MATTLCIKDETATGKILNQILIDLEKEIITVEELIMKRVMKEVEQFNNQPKVKNFNGLVRPNDTEVSLNGYKMKKHRSIDAEKQAYIALKAFKENGFFILVDDLQVDDLKHEILVTDQTDVSFIQLTPLVGG